MMVETNNIYAVIGYVLSSCYRRQVLNVLMAGTKTSRCNADELGFKRRAVTKAVNDLKEFYHILEKILNAETVLLKPI